MLRNAGCTSPNGKMKLVCRKDWLPNKEGGMPEMKLPFKSLDEVKSIKLIGTPMSPFCHTVQRVLDGYKLEYEYVEIGIMMGVSSGVKSLIPQSEYLKIPILFLDDYQINDSVTITKVLRGYLENEQTESTAESNEHLLDISSLVGHDDTALLYACLVCVPRLMCNCFSDSNTRRGYIETYMPDSWALTRMIASSFLKRGPDNIMKRQPDLHGIETMEDNLRQLMEVKEGFYFHGESPGAVDFYIFGLFDCFYGPGKPIIEPIMKASRLKKWYDDIKSMTSRSSGG